MARSRLRIGVLYTWPTFVGMVAALRGIPSFFLAIESCVAMSATAFAVYLYNDLQDIEEDTMSAKLGDAYHKDRPLVKGKGAVSKEYTKSFVLIMAIIGLGVGFLVNLAFLSLISIYLTLGFLYSTPPIHLKKRFLLKQLTIGIGGGIAGLAGGAAVGVISAPVVYAATLFFSLYFGVNPIIDLRDIYGDKSVGRRTSPIVLGPRRTIIIALMTTITLTIISVIGYAWIGFNLFFPVLSGSSFLVLIFLIYRVFNNWDNPSYIENTFLKRGMLTFFIIQIAVILGVIAI